MPQKGNSKMYICLISKYCILSLLMYVTQVYTNTHTHCPDNITEANSKNIMVGNLDGMFICIHFKAQLSYCCFIQRQAGWRVKACSQVTAQGASSLIRDLEYKGYLFSKRATSLTPRHCFQCNHFLSSASLQTVIQC